MLSHLELGFLLWRSESLVTDLKLLWVREGQVQRSKAVRGGNVSPAQGGGRPQLRRAALVGREVGVERWCWGHRPRDSPSSKKGPGLLRVTAPH